jgi:hypothetical protein
MFEMNFMLKEPFTALKQVRYKIMQWNWFFKIPIVRRS